MASYLCLPMRKQEALTSMEEESRFVQDFLDKIAEWKMIETDDIPNIPLYMDQVLTFINERLDHTKRYREDKILTKTMINNYAKNRLLPSPEKKKYTKDHMILLLFIYYFKNLLSIGDIQTLLAPITEERFSDGKTPGLAPVYRTICQLEQKGTENLSEDLHRAWEAASKVFTEEENAEEMQKFAFICLLSYDVYLKKSLIESMVDEMAEKQAAEGKTKKK